MRVSLVCCLLVAVLMMACGRPDEVRATLERPPAEVATTNAVNQAPAYSPAAAEVVRMVTSGVEESVVRNQILLRRTPYNLTADELIRMTRDGVPQSIVSVIQQHDAQLAAEVRARSRADRDGRLRRELAAAQAALANRLVTNVMPVRPVVATVPVATPAPAPPLELPAHVRSFYDALSPHGEWSRHAQYGFVWRPTIARRNSNWQPYAFNGRWLATDQGWYWHSDDPWGWAVFHYGRWGFEAALGWFWVPDTIWGPSWVTFRLDANHLGWAPLPPAAVVVAGSGVYYQGRLAGTRFDFGLTPVHYVFIPVVQVFQLPPARCLLPRARINQVFHGTAVINDIAVTASLYVVNRGVPIAHLTGRYSRRVPVSRIEVLPRNRQDEFGSRVDAGGQSIVYRPSTAVITPVKTATLTTATTNRTVLIPQSAPDRFEIVGRPVVDRSTGVPVVTGYSTAPRRRRFVPYPNIAPPTTNLQATSGPVKIRRFVPPSQGTSGFAPPVTGFAPSSGR